VFYSLFPSAVLSFSFIFYPFDITFSFFLSCVDFSCTSLHSTSISVCIFLSPAFPLHALEIVVPVFCVYMNYIHCYFHPHIFSYNFLPLFVLYLLEFQPIFLYTCQVQFLPSVTFPILYLIYAPCPRNTLTSALAAKELNFHVQSSPSLQSQIHFHFGKL
jgi:hypothetical protein